MAGGAWSQAYSGSALAYAVSGRPTGAYSYRVKACNASGCGAPSATRVTHVLVPPLAPQITASTKFQTHPTVRPVRINCSVAWTARATADSYELKVAGGGTQYTGPSTSASAPNASYCGPSHVVRACNASGCSAWSDPPFPQELVIGEPDALVADPSEPPPASDGGQ